MNLVCFATLFYTISVLCTTIGLWIVFNVPRSTDTKRKINQQLFSRYLILQIQIPKILLFKSATGDFLRLGYSGQDCSLFMWPCDCGSKGIGNDAIFDAVDYLWWVLDDPNRKCTNSFLWVWEWPQNSVMSTLEGYMNLQMRWF